jgi:hypothetical protein
MLGAGNQIIGGTQRLGEMSHGHGNIIDKRFAVVEIQKVLAYHG